MAPLRVLPGIVRAVPGLPVMLDSGVRRGTDVLKALALGARCVFVGRPFNYAASVAGPAGVAHAMALLREEVAARHGHAGRHAPGPGHAGLRAPRAGLGCVLSGKTTVSTQTQTETQQ